MGRWLVKDINKSGLENSRSQRHRREKLMCTAEQRLKISVNVSLFYVFIARKTVWQFLRVSSNALKSFFFKLIFMEERNKKSFKSKESGISSTMVFVCMWHLVCQQIKAWWRNLLVPETCLIYLFHILTPLLHKNQALQVSRKLRRETWSTSGEWGWILTITQSSSQSPQPVDTQRAYTHKRHNRGNINK